MSRSSPSGRGPGARARAKADGAAAQRDVGEHPFAAVILPRSGIALARETVITDYRLAFRSRCASLVGRREVLSGRAKFGIFGDGKELPQLALAKAFQDGDWRSGYYRDQTLALATGMCTLRTLFGQLYADTDVEGDPASCGRQMNNHFATRFIDPEGRWLPTLEQRNSSADLAPVASWMPRLLGLASASKLYRLDRALAAVAEGHTRGGNEVAFGTIGDASTSEGPFFETVNAAAVLQVPIALSVWDDGFGISVPTALQTAKGSISDALRGLEHTATRPGMRIHVVPGWDYVTLCDTYISAVEQIRREHVPALFHITELTQPQGHSTSGSHERYKSAERLAWERDHDCVGRMREWMLTDGIAASADLDEWEQEERELVETERAVAWDAAMRPARDARVRVVELVTAAAAAAGVDLAALIQPLDRAAEVNRRSVDATASRALWALRHHDSGAKDALADFVEDFRSGNRELYTSHLHSQSSASPRLVPVQPPLLGADAPAVDGRMVLLRCFDENLARDPRIVIRGEDVGRLGDVNLVFEGLQAKYGEHRISDTGIREATILGQAIGEAMRGLRPIADIQYLDYLLYALQLASDDLATLHWRTGGGQKAPVIIRTKGHRLQGVWHAGSPMGTVVNALRGVHVVVPRDCTRAAGFYNTLLRGDDPALVVEVLNAYRLKERVPSNVGTFTLALGRPETLRSGDDLTVVTYGACCRIALEAAGLLEELGVDIEVIDVQTLAPFDDEHMIVASLRRTGAVLFLDEDVPGGASAYMMQKVLEEQSGWLSLDATPRTLTASDTRCAYAADGEYYSKPSVEDVVRAAYDLARERDPSGLPPIDVAGGM